MRKARLAKGMSLSEASRQLGFPATATLSQLELGQRNFTYPIAVKVRDFFEMDFDLPEVSFDNVRPIRRDRGRRELKKGPIFLEVDGFLIKVMTYYDMGHVSKARRLSDVK
ncbi:MAG: helix-turn-helix transcriptional regulator [Chitinophagaceae bacterium]